MASPVYWTEIELCSSIISACLPCMRPLLTGFLKQIGYESSQDRPTNVASLNTWRSSHTRVNSDPEFAMWKDLCSKE